MVDLSRAVWRKSTLSSSSGCVEVTLTEGAIAVRDSKDRSGPILLFNGPEWQAFVGAVRMGEFDLPRPTR
jgi:hypothetical protein